MLAGDPFFDAFSEFRLASCRVRRWSNWRIGVVGKLDALASWKCWRVGRVDELGELLAGDPFFDAFFVRFCEQRYGVMTEFDRRFPYRVGPSGFGPSRVGPLDVVRLGCWCVGLLECWRLDTLRDGKANRIVLCGLKLVLYVLL